MKCLRYRASFAVILTASLVVVSGAQVTDPLAAMRTAIGGDLVLNAIVRFSVSGTLVRRLADRRISNSYEVKCELPDKFITITRTESGGPFPMTMQMIEGFNGDEPIREAASDRPGGPPMFIPGGPVPRTPDEIAADRLRRARSSHKEFVRFVLPLVGRSFPGSELAFSVASNSTVDGTAVNVVRVVDWEGNESLLAIDAATNLPKRLTWQAKPIVTATTSSLETVRGGQITSSSAPVLLPADPTAGMTNVEHAIAFSDFKTDNGVTWPRRMVRTVAGEPWVDLTLGKYNLAPKFGKDTFKPSKN